MESILTESTRQKANEARRKVDEILTESISIERRLSGSSVLTTLSLEEIATLQARKSALDIQLPVAERELKRANQAHTAAIRAEEDRQTEIELCRIHLRNADSELRGYLDSIGQAESDLRAAEMALARARRDLESHDARIAGVRVKLEALENGSKSEMAKAC